jgi:hypothetical protein
MHEAPYYGRHVVLVLGEADDVAAGDLHFLCANFATELQYVVASRSCMEKSNGMMYGLAEGVLKLKVGQEDLTRDRVVEVEDGGEEEEAFVEECR